MQGGQVRRWLQKGIAAAGVSGGSAITIGNDRPGGEGAALGQNQAA
jgi:hypothetical protein